MYGVRILEKEEHINAFHWKLFDVAEDIENDVEDWAPYYLGLLHMELSKDKGKFERLKNVLGIGASELREISPKKRERIKKWSQKMAEKLEKVPKCKLHSNISIRVKNGEIPKRSIKKARLFSVCVCLENGIHSKKFTEKHVY